MPGGICLVPRSAVAICLPVDEFRAVSAELADAGYEAIEVLDAAELEALLDSRPDVGLAILVAARRRTQRLVADGRFGHFGGSAQPRRTRPRQR